MAGMTLNIQSSTAAIVDAFGTRAIGPFSVAGTATMQQLFVNLVNGNNTITVPTGVPWVGVIIVPPTTNTVALKYKTTSGDTGVVISPSLPSVFIFDSTTPSLPVSLFINAASNTTGNTSLLFW